MGGQFERMVGLVKQALYKTIGRANLRWPQLEEVILDVEIALNNRPLAYQEDDVQLPALTPNVMVLDDLTCYLKRIRASSKIIR